MTSYRKVVWNEGMLLTPHHFQQWDNYYEELLNLRIGTLSPYPWGVLNLQMNDAAIAKGFCEVSQCRALMPDGLLVNISQVDAAPDSRPVGDSFGSAERLGVYLAIPTKRVGSANYQPNGGERHPFIRYGQDALAVKDETTGQNEQQLAFASNNLRLMFEDEVRDGYNSIKIAEIQRTATGGMVYNENYIPPALDIAASPWLHRALKEIIDILTVKSSSLSDQRRQRPNSLTDFTTSEVAVFWLLHTVNSFLPRLAHLLRTRPVHPEQLYTELATLSGQLITFVIDRHPQSIVHYQHTDLYATFNRLMIDLRELLETVIPSRYVQIALERTPEGYYIGRVHDDRLLADAEFYLAVKARVSEGQLIERVPEIVKIASKDVIESIVRRNIPGVTLTHSSPPPSPIPTRIGYHYFNLSKLHRLWTTVDGAKNITIYVPAELIEPALELYAVKP